MVLALFVVMERLYESVEEAGVHGRVGGMKSEVENLRADGDVWHVDDRRR